MLGLKPHPVGMGKKMKTEALQLEKVDFCFHDFSKLTEFMGFSFSFQSDLFHIAFIVLAWFVSSG